MWCTTCRTVCCTERTATCRTDRKAHEQSTTGPSNRIVEVVFQNRSEKHCLQVLAKFYCTLLVGLMASTLVPSCCKRMYCRRTPAAQLRRIRQACSGRISRRRRFVASPHRKAYQPLRARLVSLIFLRISYSARRRSLCSHPSESSLTRGTTTGNHSSLPVLVSRWMGILLPHP